MAYIVIVIPKHLLVLFQGLYCEVRQFLNYVKEIHGGTFRQVALSGLLESLHKTTYEKEKPKTMNIMRYRTSNMM